MNDLVGKKMLGFKFSGGPGYITAMNSLLGKEGVIKSHSDRSCQVKFSNGTYWSHPYPEILDHLVEDEKTIEEIIVELKQITSKL